MASDSHLAPASRRIRALARVAALLKVGWVLLVLAQGDYDYRRAMDEDVARVVGALFSVPLHFAFFVALFYRDWPRYALVVLALASIAGLSGSGLFYGLPYYLRGNYTHDEALVPWLVANIVVNLALCALMLHPAWKRPPTPKKTKAPPPKRQGLPPFNNSEPAHRWSGWGVWGGASALPPTHRLAPFDSTQCSSRAATPKPRVRVPPTHRVSPRGSHHRPLS